MKKNTLFTILATFLVTTLLWLTVYLVVVPALKGGSATPQAEAADPAVRPADPDPEAPRYRANARRDVDYTAAIVGHWEPVEVSPYVLDFSEFGTLKTRPNNQRHPVTTSYKYQLLGDRLGYTEMVEFYEGDWHRIAIDTAADGCVYLSVFDDPELGGRYCRR